MAAATEWHEVLVIAAGHSEYDTEKLDYQPMPEGTRIKTILPADIGIDCFSDMEQVHEIIKDMIKGGYHKSPEDILEILGDSLKPIPIFAKGKVAKKDEADFCRFLECTGEISTNETEYFNKSWIFERDFGGIFIIIKGPERLLLYQLFAKRDVVTKKEVVDYLLQRFKNILFVDISCSGTKGSPASIAAFKTKGAYGGKLKKTKKRKSKK